MLGIVNWELENTATGEKTERVNREYAVNLAHRTLLNGYDPSTVHLRGYDAEGNEMVDYVGNELLAAIQER